MPEPALPRKPKRKDRKKAARLARGVERAPRMPRCLREMPPNVRLMFYIHLIPEDELAILLSGLAVHLRDYTNTADLAVRGWTAAEIAPHVSLACEAFVEGWTAERESRE